MKTISSLRSNENIRAIRTNGRFWFWPKHGLPSLLTLLIPLPSSGAAHQFAATWADQRKYLPVGQLTNEGAATDVSTITVEQNR